LTGWKSASPAPRTRNEGMEVGCAGLGGSHPDV
jgi:hypothetical protein